MPNDVYLWLLIVVLVTAVVLFAVLRGYNVKASTGRLNATLSRPERAPRETVVGENLEIRSGTTVGNVTGEQNSGMGAPPDGRVEVLKDGRIYDGSHVGNITGRDIRAG